MGGRGSGNWYRWNKKNITEDYRCWDIKKLVEAGFLQEEVKRSGSGTWSTTRMGIRRKDSSVSFITDTLDSHNHFIRVQYTNTKTEEEFDYKIRLTTTNPHYGGKRWWWVCPLAGCGKRVGILYLTGRYFSCRHCLNLAYESQNEAQGYRLLTKAQNIHERLGGSGCTDDWTPRPKGMHQKTYDRLMEEMERYYNNSVMGMGFKKRT